MTPSEITPSRLKKAKPEAVLRLARFLGERTDGVPRDVLIYRVVAKCRPGRAYAYRE